MKPSWYARDSWVRRLPLTLLSSICTATVLDNTTTNNIKSVPWSLCHLVTFQSSRQESVCCLSLSHVSVVWMAKWGRCSLAPEVYIIEAELSPTKVSQWGINACEIRWDSIKDAFIHTCTHTLGTLCGKAQYIWLLFYFIILFYLLCHQDIVNVIHSIWK